MAVDYSHNNYAHMNPNRVLNEIQDELDSRQINVQLQATPFGVIVKSRDYASVLIAKAELKRRGVMILE